MANSFDSVLESALALPAECRATLAERLLQSLDAEDQAKIDSAWVAEALKRLAAAESGEARTIPEDEVFQALSARKSEPL